jgi:protein phosphatase
MAHTITAASATRQGTREYTGDAAAIHRLPGSDTVAACVVDAIGATPEGAEWSALAAQVAARVGARKTSILGLLAAAELNAGHGADPIRPDGVAVLAIAAAARSTSIAWTGDARAYGYDGHTLHERTTDMTVGEYLRKHGYPLDATRAHDDWLRATLGRSSINTVHHTAIDDPLVLLTSDGVHKQIGHEQLTALVRAHEHDPHALAAAIVAAPEADAGYRDDATAIVLRYSA